MENRQYQDDLLNEIKRQLRTVRSVCAVSPTGSGKTVMFLRIIQGAVAKGKTVWVIVHSEELVEQTCEKLREAGIAHGVIQGKNALLNCPVQVCMIQTLKNKLGHLHPPSIIIVDECHHTPAAMYDKVLAWAPPTTKIIGFTASPERLDGKGLKHHYQAMVKGPSPLWLMEQGFLVPAVVYWPPGVDTSSLHTKYGDFVQREAAELMRDQKIVGDILGQWMARANGLQTIVFAASVNEAYRLAELFNNNEIPSVAVDGSVPKAERKRRVQDFKDRKYRCIMNYQLFTEGVDCPGIECVVIARITQSRALHVQMIGRGLRPDRQRGKTECIILDHAGNTARLMHPPELDYDWTLDGSKAQKDSEDDESISLTTCPDCFVMYRGRKCPKCDFVLQQDREIKYIAGELVQLVIPKRNLDGAQYERLRASQTKQEFVSLCQEMEVEISAARRILKARAKSLTDLRHVESILEFAHGWARHLYEARHGKDGLKEALAAERAACIAKVDSAGEGARDGERKHG